MWPFNRGWPLNGGPLNRGSTVSASRITFYFFINPFQDSSQPIQLQYFLWIYPEQVVAELTRVTYVAEINKSSPSRAIWGCLLDSSHFS
jgi:hypothetical protein